MAYDLEQYTSDAVQVIANSMMTHLGHIMTPRLQYKIRTSYLVRQRFLWLVYGGTQCLAQQFRLPEEQAFVAVLQVFMKLNDQAGSALAEASKIRRQLLQGKPLTRSLTNAGKNAMEEYFGGEDVYAFTRVVKLLEASK